jgi:hypothetical protein
MIDRGTNKYQIAKAVNLPYSGAHQTIKRLLRHNIIRVEDTAIFGRTGLASEKYGLTLLGLKHALTLLNLGKIDQMRLEKCLENYSDILPIFKKFGDFKAKGLSENAFWALLMAFDRTVNAYDVNVYDYTPEMNGEREDTSEIVKRISEDFTIWGIPGAIDENNMEAIMNGYDRLNKMYLEIAPLSYIFARKVSKPWLEAVVEDEYLYDLFKKAIARYKNAISEILKNIESVDKAIISIRKSTFP